MKMWSISIVTLNKVASCQGEPYKPEGTRILVCQGITCWLFNFFSGGVVGEPLNFTSFQNLPFHIASLRIGLDMKTCQSMCWPGFSPVLLDCGLYLSLACLFLLNRVELLYSAGSLTFLGILLLMTSFPSWINSQCLRLARVVFPPCDKMGGSLWVGARPLMEFSLRAREAAGCSPGRSPAAVDLCMGFCDSKPMLLHWKLLCFTELHYIFSPNYPFVHIQARKWESLSFLVLCSFVFLWLPMSAM